MMLLCDICKSVQFEHLPPFPEDEYLRTLTELEYVHVLVRKRGLLHTATAPAVRHHTSIEGLRWAAARGCELCLLIQGEADYMIAELESHEGAMKPYGNGLPTFNMWLTQRPEGGQGFWVLSECGDGRVIVAVAAFSFGVEEDDVLDGIFRGNQIKQIPDMQTLQRMVKWNAECEQNHNCCETTDFMPSHLIDVQSPKSADFVKLVEVDAGARQRYTSLTYACEHGIVGYWETTSRPENGNIRFADLPKTFQDAVVVTRTLGIQYLWIDSLCIPGDPREWARDSEQAGFVYANAYLTISATGSGSVADGLFCSRPSHNYLRMPWTTNDDVTGTLLVSTLPLAKEVIRSRYIEMEKERISKGVWSFQERVLSRRIVHFASDQMYFECLKHFISEDGLLERLRYHTTVEALPDGTHHYRERAGHNSFQSRWFSILWDYGRRQVITPSDKLSAISNVARDFQRMLDSEYAVGHWKKSLVESLCWQSLSCKLAGDRSIPSWSWASMDGLPVMGFGNNSAHLIATITATQTSLLDEAKPFGRVTTASIELESPLIPLELFDKGGTLHLRSGNGVGDDFYANFDTIDSHNPASAESLQARDIFALVLAETHKGQCSPGICKIRGSYRGLVVTPTEAAGTKMKRLGFILTSALTFGCDDVLNLRKSVVLV